MLANDTDVDGDALSAVAGQRPRRTAALTLNADGSFTYTPSANYNGPDSFTYKANDGTADSNVATVIDHRQRGQRRAGGAERQRRRPTRTRRSPATCWPTTPTSTATPLTRRRWSAARPTAALTLNADGSFTYTPAANYNGPDSFTYKANDGTADSNVATVIDHGQRRQRRAGRQCRQHRDHARTRRSAATC